MNGHGLHWMRGAVAAVVIGAAESTSTTAETLIEQWDGSSWSLMTSVNPSSVSGLSGVSCTSDTNCVAVGISGRPGQTLVESWDGTAWSVVPSPSGDPGGDGLEAVSCTSASMCVAVGSSHGNETSLTEIWDGESWTVAPSARGLTVSLLTSVSCYTASRCVAVGLNQGSGPAVTTEQWNGRKWTVMPGGATNLWSVSCTSGTQCFAVGGGLFDGKPGSLVDTWNGTAWTVSEGPSPGTDINTFLGVSCLSADHCLAVGSWGNSHRRGSHYRTLIASWDGTAWTQVASPSAPHQVNSTLYSVSCAARHRCATVGLGATGPARTTLALTNG